MRNFLIRLLGGKTKQDFHFIRDLVKHWDEFREDSNLLIKEYPQIKEKDFKNGHQKCIDLKKIVSIDYTTDKKLIVRLVNKLSDFEIPDTSQESYEDLLLIWSHWCE